MSEEINAISNCIFVYEGNLAIVYIEIREFR